MKKWLVAFIGIFMLLGACIFSACGNQSAKLTLSHESVRVEVHSDEVGRDEFIVTAEVNGAKEYSLEPSGDYADYLSVTTRRVSATKTHIIIKGLAENDSPSVVTIKVAPGNVEKNIYVDVFSQIKTMTQNQEPQAKRKNFFVRGEEKSLADMPLLSINPEKADKEIVWQLATDYDKVSLEGEMISVADEFEGGEVRLIAISSNGVESDEIVVPVLDKIIDNVDLLWSYSQNSSFEEVEAGEEVGIVSNISDDAFVAVDYNGPLSIQGYAKDMQERETDLIVVNRNDQYENKPLFRISAKQNVTNLNEDFYVGFRIGYADYDYAFDTMESCPILVKAREKVNKITISTDEVPDLSGSAESPVLYTQYANTDKTTTFGSKFYVSITPSTVVDKTNQYSIYVSRTGGGGQILPDGDLSCPVEFWYKDSLNGNIWTQIEMKQEAGGYVPKNFNPSVSTIYMKAYDKITQQMVTGINVQFKSIDNPDITTDFDVVLVKAVSEISINVEDASFKIDSSENGGNVVAKKTLTIKGQTSMNGLYAINKCEAVEVSLQYISGNSAENSVIFDVVVELLPSSYGITSNGVYQIAHENGVVSEEFEIDVFLPLKDVGVRQSVGENLLDSVTDQKFDNKTYLLDGEEFSTNIAGLSALMLKNKTTTPLAYSFNSVNGRSAEAEISVGFMDFNPGAKTFEEFKALQNTDVAEIISEARGKTSSVAHFENNFKSLVTDNVGYTYAVIFFKGKSVENADTDGNITLARIIFIESYVSPNGIAIIPTGDRDVVLYGVDSLSTSDSQLTRKAINISFATPNVTYADLTKNIEFVSASMTDGINISGNSVSWTNGRYLLSNVVVDQNGLSFNIDVVGTFGEVAFYDTLNVHYVLKNDNGDKVYDIYVPIDITIKNAQRVESLIWKNSSEDGLYFKVRDTSAQYVLLESLPSTARNNSVHYVKTNQYGQFISRESNSFVSVSDSVASNVVALNLPASITSGMTGYVYLMPADAVYDNQIRYYYMDNETERMGSISDSQIGEIKDNGLGITYYDFLVNNAYFKSNATDGDAVYNVPFADILTRIKIVVVDGSSFEYSYRIFDNQTFKGIKPDLYYTVMNSLDLSDDSFKTISDFRGGLQGINENIVLKLNKTFAETINQGAQVRNLTFVGDVDGSGLVANVNEGIITNVAVDVDGVSSSKLNVSSGYGGGLVGVNEGTIENSSVLGLTIAGAGTVGGIAGLNNGVIRHCKIEFYNFAREGTTVNTFTGETVGGIVGVIGVDSSIFKTYAYSYVHKVPVLIGTNVGSFAGKVVGTPGSALIDYSFAYVNNSLVYSNYEVSIAMTNYYYAYYSGDTYDVTYVAGYNSNGNFASEDQEGFESYVNNGKPHLKELMQDKKVASVDYSVKTVKDANGYYKSLAVQTAEGENKKGIMFAYVVDNKAQDLSASEINDLNRLNSISISSLVGEEVDRRIVVSSSNPSVVRVVGSTLNIVKAGTTTLTLYSKQDASISQQIEITVVYPLSEMSLSWVGSANKLNYVQENSILGIQKTRSRDLTASFDKTQAYLGQTANAYDLKLNDYRLVYETIVEEGKEAVSIENTSNSSIKVTASEDSVKTDVVVSPKIFNDAILQKAVDAEFARNFAVQPTDGVISFGISGTTVPLTPSSQTAVRVEIRSTSETDSVVPVMKYRNDLLIENEDDGKFSYTLPRDVASGSPIIDAVVKQVSSITEDGVSTRVFDVYFSINASYKTKISEDMDFEVHFESTSGNSSEQWGGVFTLAVTRQEFTSIDVQILKISESVFADIEGSVAEVHTAKEKVAVVAPGNSAILQVNVNPTFAYYDYVELSYSFGEEIVVDAVHMEVVKTHGANKFTRRAVDSSIESSATTIRFTPTPSEKESGSLYFKIWVNTTVEKDSQINFTATFKEAGGDIISYVTSPLTISYLTQPRITIDGLDTAYIAKGSTAQIKVEVLADQKVDSVVIEGEEISGISLGKLESQGIDPEKGINTYTSTISASVLAKAKDNQISVQAKVSRELNGSKEYKNAVATLIIVDFKIDSENIQLVGANEDNLVVGQGAAKALNFEYNLIPEKYTNVADAETQNAINALISAKETFKTKEYYPDVDNANDADYLVNYVYDENGNLVKDERGNPKPVMLKDRLFYVAGNRRIPVNEENAGIDSPIKFIFDEVDNKVSVTGIKLSGEIQVALITYVSTGGLTVEYEKIFTVTVKPWSTKDLPLLISNAEEFEALNPEGQTNFEPNNYILTNDIVLENYTPFDTRMIESFDGNGFTIYIKSFNTTPQNTNILNLALFNRVVEHTIDGKSVPTTLKNVRVNIYNGGQIIVNTNIYETINIAGLAIENNGLITNCEVVSFYTERGAVGQVLSQSACMAHSKPDGINVVYTDGINTTQQVFHDGFMEWDSNIAGFVLTNNGNITNSRVGGDSVIMIDSEKVVEGEDTGYTHASHQQLGRFNIIGQGNIAGFVLENAGYISSSFAKNVDLDNKSNSTRFYVAGFVGTNSSKILASYVEGQETDPSLIKSGDCSAFAREGSSIKSTSGIIAGFIYKNTGEINDSYSNILISNKIESNRVYLASGFVYQNEGALENCYSASQIQNSVFTQMNFSGVSPMGDLLATGTYTNCYFFNSKYESSQEANDTTTESRYSTGAVLVPAPNDRTFFYGFAIAEGENDGIWRIDEEKGITLIEANDISVSHRYVHRIKEGTNFEGSTAEDEKGKYILPYSTLTFLGTSLEIDTSLGGASNPIILQDAEGWVDAMGLSTSRYESEYFDQNIIWGNYRLANNIDLSDLASSESSVQIPSSSRAFAGKLSGNGFEISGVSITTEQTGVAFGLFASIESIKGYQPIVTNLDIEVEQVVAGDVYMVGALAGYIKDAKIINIEIALKEKGQVSGLNFVGALAGFASGDNIFKNILVRNPQIVAGRYVENEEEGKTYYYDAKEIKNSRADFKNSLNYSATTNSQIFESFKNYSYAGGVVGFVDNYGVEKSGFDYTQKDNFSINSVRVEGVVNVQAQVAGGAFGLLGYQTNIRDVGVVISGTSQSNSSRIIATKYFAGGVAGQSFGSINRTFAVHEKTVQGAIEDNMSAYYAGNEGVERGILDLFSSQSTKYTQKYIGGLIGYVGSGNIEVSYSKLNVASATADYAGGIIGGTELEESSSYQGKSVLAEPVFTKLFINEVFATGDVRAKIFAGGIIGVINGEGSTVALMAVNAYNYFTTYDYEKGVYGDINQGQEKLSANFKIHTLVGKLIDNEGNVPDTGYESYIKLVQTKSRGESGEEKPSVSVYEDYKFAGQSLKVDATDNDSNIPNNKYFITGPDKYTNSAVGHSFTQEGFLNSDAWVLENWTHPTEELFPDIRFKRGSDVIYLDAYKESIIATFKAMQSNNPRVIVRGLTQPGGEEYSHVDIRSCLSASEIEKIASFSGRLQGGIYQTSIGEEIQDVRIIASDNFISSVGPGFYADNLTVEYKNSITLEGSNAGLFVNSPVEQATIKGLKIILNNKVSVNVGDSNTNIGIIAPTLTSTSVRGFELSANVIGEGETIISVVGKDAATASAPDGAEKEQTEINVGLIAGKIRQTSRISMMIVDGITINTKANPILVQNIDFDNICLGSYFGATEKSADAQDLRITLSNLKSYGESQISITATGINKDVENLYIGGYIGYADSISRVSTADEKKISSDIMLRVEGSGKITNLYVGGVFAISSTVSAEIDGRGSNLNTLVELPAVNIINSYIGGFAGKTTTGEHILTGFEKIDLSLVNKETGDNIESPSKEEFTGGYGTQCAVIANAEGYVGVVVGYTDAQFTFKGNSSSLTKLNEGEQPIKISAPENSKIYFGSVLGFTNAEVSPDSNSVSITGKITSNAQVVVNGGGSASLGGMVGKIVGANASTVVVKAQISDNNSMLRFDGAFYTDVKKSIVSGILGEYESYDEQDSLSIIKTSFGGAVKLYGIDDEDFTFGGTIGKSTTKGDVSVQYNYNYGDVFAEYVNDANVLDSYCFGGLIGFIESGGDYSVLNNYSLTTSHNARLSTGYYNNALFGQGATTSVGTNYYNHAVALANDQYGIDLGYTLEWSTCIGYESAISYSSTDSIVEIIKKGFNLEGLDKGHKLNPANYTALGALEEAKTFNGIKYYKAEGNTTNVNIASVENVALIGNGNTIKFVNDNKDKSSFVTELKGYSSVSGFVLDVEISIENVKENENYAALIGSMNDNSIVYAINVQGSLQIGGENKANVAGLVGKFTSGRIFDCSTDLDIVYRAGNGGTISAISNADTNGVTIIENTYATGSLKTMVSAKIYAFAGGSISTINNCYTITKIDRHDYTIADESTMTGTVAIEDADRVLYDVDGLNYKGLTAGKKYTELTDLLGTDATDTKGIFSAADWEVDYKFNYGYPTLKYQYLKRSSYATVTFTAEGTSGYDAVVQTGAYTRLANGTGDIAEGSYFMIPNAGVLANMKNISVGNFALLYDIDWTARGEEYTACSFTGNFDGRGKTINGLKSGLFSEVGKSDAPAVVRNLRLTDAELSAGGLLAGSITNATISNITVSGFITANSGNVGGLANSANGANIYAVTNMIDIQASCAGNYSVGGIVGTSTNSNFEYCSNYGPINVVSTTNGYTVNVGGIVGSATAGKINYSSNNTSVLNNYATTSALCTTSGTFIAGGIVGRASELTIEFCYNAGMVKSGNKSNTAKSYAGGIFGSGTSLTVNNYYSQGTVEALAVNPTFVWKWENISSKLCLVLIQESERNVFAYAVGYSEGGESTVSGGLVNIEQLSINKDEDKLIFNNGAYNAKDAQIASWLWDDIKAMVTEGALYNLIGRGTNSSAPYYYEWNYTKVDYIISAIQPSVGKTDQIVVTSLDELDVPKTFLVPIKTKITLGYYQKTYWMVTRPPIFALNYENGLRKNPVAPTSSGFTEENDDNGWTRYSKTGEYDAYNGVVNNDYYKTFVKESYSKLHNATQNKDNSVKFKNDSDFASSAEELIQLMRSNVEDAKIEDVLKVSIAGKEHYIADRSNMNLIFNAGIYQVSGYIESNKLPYFTSKDKYTISATLVDTPSQEIIPTITGVEFIESSGVKVSYVLQSTQPINGTANLTIKASSDEEMSFDVSDLKYEYINDYSIGISNLSISTGDAYQMQGYKIQENRTDGKLYDHVIMLSTAKGNSDGETASGARVIYLAKSDNKYILIPSAKLLFGEEDKGIVNTQYGVLNSANFTSQVKTILDDLAGRTYYARYSGESEMRSVVFSAGGDGEIKFNAINGDGTLSFTYGENVSPTISVTAVDKLTSIDGESVDTKQFEISLSNAKEMLGLSVENIVLAYKPGNGITATQGILAEGAKMTINGIEYTISIAGGKIVLSNDEAIANIIRNVIDDKIAEIRPDIESNVRNSFEESIRENVETNAGEMTADQIDAEIARLLAEAETDILSEIELQVSNALFDAKSELDQTINSLISPTQNSLSTMFEGYSYISNKEAEAYIEIPSLTINGDAKTLATTGSGNSWTSTITAEQKVGEDGTLSATIVVNGEIQNGTINSISDGKIRIKRSVGPDSIKQSFGGVDVYYGTTTGDNVSYSYSTSVTYVKFHNNENVPAYYEVNYDKAEGNPILTGIINSGTADYNTQNNDAYKELEGEVKLSATMYQTYKRQEDDLDDFQVVLEKDETYLYEGTIVTSEEGENIEQIRISKLVKRTDGKKTWVRMEYGAGEIDDKYVESINFYVGETTILMIKTVSDTKEGEGETTYYTGEDITVDEDGNVTVKEGNPSAPNEISYKEEGKTFKIAYANLMNLSDFNKINELIAIKEIENQGKIIYVKDNSFKVKESASHYVAETEKTSNTVVEKNSYEWGTIETPTYNQIEKDPSFDKYNWAFASTTTSSQVLVNDKENHKAILILKPSDAKTNNYAVSYTFADKTTDNEFKKEGISQVEGDALEALSIILTKDISFKDLGIGFIKKGDVNIIGNGFNVVYSGSQLYKQVGESAQSSFIRDVSFLGTTENLAILSNNIKKTSLNNIKIYGSVIGISDKCALLSADADSEINGLYSYASVYGAVGKDITLLGGDLFATEGGKVDGLINYGVIVAQRGRDGDAGANGGLSRAGTSGSAGSKGNSINAFSTESPKFEIQNEGILRVGDGGNGGAGGSHGRGVDLISSSSTESAPSYEIKAGGTTATSGGEAGAGGTVAGFKLGKAIGQGGKKGSAGYVARDGYGHVQLKNTAGFWWLYPYGWVKGVNGKHTITKGQDEWNSDADNHESFENIYKWLFTDSQIQEFPSDVYEINTPAT